MFTYCTQCVLAALRAALIASVADSGGQCCYIVACVIDPHKYDKNKLARLSNVFAFIFFRFDLI